MLCHCWQNILYSIPLPFLLLREEQIFKYISFLSCLNGMGNLDISEQSCKLGELGEKQFFTCL